MKDRVYLAACADYEKETCDKAVHDCLEAFGGASALAGGKRVLIKANLLMASSPDEAVTTHPRIIAALAKEFIAAGCKVEIADSCGGLYNKDVLNKLYAVCGMKKAAEETGAELNYDISHFERRFPNGKKIEKANVISPVERADFIISAAKMKTHGLTYYTGAVKNMFGVIPGTAKAVMHSRFPDKKAFCEMIVDLCEGVRPDFSIIDGVIGMEGAGPSGGSPKKVGVLVASQSPYAADVAAIDIMGLDCEKSPVHKIAKKRGLVDEVEISGESAERFRVSFEPAYKGEAKTVLSVFPSAARRFISKAFAAYPNIIKSKCVGCGECARDCPEKTIEIKDKKAHINYKKCIRCYCCQELCPARAIKIERFARFKKRK